MSKRRYSRDPQQQAKRDRLRSLLTQCGLPPGLKEFPDNVAVITDLAGHLDLKLLPLTVLSVIKPNLPSQPGAIPGWVRQIDAGGKVVTWDREGAFPPQEAPHADQA